MAISAVVAADYLTQYVQHYRTEYHRFTAQPPSGGGYPSLRISPYLYSSELTCYLALDGAVVADQSWEPSYQWEISGGPTLLVDYTKTRTPPQVIAILRRQGLLGKPIGIYRLVVKERLPDYIWGGQLPPPLESAEVVVDGSMRLRVYKYDLNWHHLIERLTFGAFGRALDLHLPDVQSPLWNPRIVRDLGFATADRLHKRYFHYLELIPHLDEAAWDVRSIWARVQVDIRRDFAHSFAAPSGLGAMISLDSSQPEIRIYYDRLSVLKGVIDHFEMLLNEQGLAEEAVFHDFIKQNPILLDVYGEAVSKPRFPYRAGESPLGKAYIEPDFIIQYPGNRYKIVEIERPEKVLATKQGQPRAEVGQAAFQIGEFKSYVKTHYDLLKDRFPGISIGHSTMLVIGRATSESVGEGRDIPSYLGLLSQQYGVDEVLPYDYLLERAKQAYLHLATLTPER